MDLRNLNREWSTLFRSRDPLEIQNESNPENSGLGLTKFVPEESSNSFERCPIFAYHIWAQYFIVSLSGQRRILPGCAGLGGSVGCAIRLETRRSRVPPLPRSATFLSLRLIMKYFLRLFSPFRWFKKDSCQFLAKECAQFWLTA